MTDTAVDTRSQFRQHYDETMKAISEIDEKLDAAQDSTGKRKFTNEIVEEYKEEWSPVTDTLQKQMGEMEPKQLAAAFYGIVRTLTSAYKDDVDKWLAEQVETQPKSDEEALSEEEKKSLSETRSELSRRVKLLIEMAGTFGEFTEDNPWQEPKRRGAVGKRGPRALNLFTWQIDGQPVDEDNDTPKGVSELLGFEKASEFTKALKEAKINTTNPPDQFTVTIKGKEVYASRPTDEEESDPTQPSDDASEGDEETE